LTLTKKTKKRLEARGQRIKTVSSLQQAVDIKKKNIKLFSHRFSLIETGVKDKKREIQDSPLPGQKAPRTGRREERKAIK
jgi:hypothetical protein